MSSELYWVVDIGGTKILTLLIDENKKVLYRRRNETPGEPAPEDIAGVVNRAMSAEPAQKILSAAGKKARGLGVCIAGFVDYKSGLVHQSPNLEWHESVPLGSILSAAVNCPVLVENDTNAAVLGEVYHGAARGHENVIYITLSTGIGGGLLLNGHLYRGANGFAGEIGHTKDFGQGRTCKCGGRDCLEVWASGSALARTASELFETADLGIEELNTSTLFDLAEEGNTEARSVINHAAELVGLGLSNMVTLLNPSCMVIGGGVAANRPDFFQQVAAMVKKNAIRPAVEITPLQIKTAELEPESGIWGIYSLLRGQAG